MGPLRDPDTVSHWLTARRDHLGTDVLEVHAERVEQLSRGVSRETWAVDAVLQTAGGSRPAALVVRRDHPAGSVIPTPLRQEYDVYAGLTGTQVPVAEALFYEDDPNLQPDGRPAYVRRRVDGHWRLPFLLEDDPALDDVRIAASKEHLTKLSLVHTLDWRECGLDELLPTPSSAAEAGRSLVQRMRAQIEDLLEEPHPLLAEACAVLLETAPEDAPALVLCKGTNGHGEEVWRDGRIVALSDWELACIGDPAYDLAQVQDMVPEIVRDGRRLWGWPEALEFHAAQSGLPVTQERLDWYRSCYGLLQLAYTSHSAAAVQRSSPAPARFLWTAYEVAYHAELRLAAAVGVAAGAS